MSPGLRFLRWALASTAARKRTLIGLVALPLATALVVGIALGIGAERGGWGAIALPASIPLAVLGAMLAGRVLLRAAQSVRRVQNALWIAEKVEPLRLEARDEAPSRINIVHPAIDLKHFFGGFIAVFNLARRLIERGHRVRLIAMEDSDLPRDWRTILVRYEGLGGSLGSLEVAFAGDRTREIEINPQDALIATHWTAAHVAAAALGKLQADRFLYLIQEYEPFIFPSGSAAALARASYDHPHTALFSTELLREWFALQGIGVFAEGRAAGERDSLSFENAITKVGPVSAADLSRPGPRRLLFYARPEEHAARNLFEIGAMALDQAMAAGAFAGWDIAGIGTVELRGTLPLPRSGATMRLLPRAPQDDYARLLRDFDVGLALMYTPHPSLVPIEMAAAGMTAVTNTFENKDAVALRRISTNLLAAEPSVQGVAAGLAAAEARTEQLEERGRGSQVAWPTTWDEALDDSLLTRLERLLWTESPPDVPQQLAAVTAPPPPAAPPG